MARKALFIGMHPDKTDRRPALLSSAANKAGPRLAKTKVLFLGPHPDDVEFGAGGILAKLLRIGYMAEIVTFSTCAESLPPGYPPDLVVEEMKDSMKSLGITDYSILDFRVRDFPAHRQDILEHLVKIRSSKKYDLVIAPSPTDLHQDHSVLGTEATRAFPTSSMLHYEITNHHKSFLPTVYVEIAQDDLNTKISAVRCYKTQIKLRPRFSDPRNIEAIARVRGMQIQTEFAEAFEISRLVVRDGKGLV
jgi:LmbE family N-acetylglucosaminyl deacetylase